MKSARILTLVLVLCMVSVCFLSGTVAKYTSTGTGTDTANVAKWKFTVEGTDIATTDEWTFDLFNTIKDSNTSSDETDVNANLIAPGTSGSFQIDLNNASDVTSKFGIAFSVENIVEDAESTPAIPVKYRVKLNGNYIDSDWTDVPTNIDADSTLYDAVLETAASTVPGASDDAVVIVEWKWDFEVNDAQNTNDTEIGKDSVTGEYVQLKVTATVTATQVD